MKRAIQKGFTLIELVVVIVILGILAAIAVPQFTDLAADAKLAVANGACGAVQSAAVLRYASVKAQSNASDIVASVSTSGVALTGATCNGITATPTGGSALICPIVPTALCKDG